MLTVLKEAQIEQVYRSDSWVVRAVKVKGKRPLCMPTMEPMALGMHSLVCGYDLRG